MMVTLEQLQKKDAHVCVVGLGYVGLPLATLLAKYFSVIGFDINQQKVEEIQQGIDKTGEVDLSTLPADLSIRYSADPAVISEAQFIIVAVPTPVTEERVPDLTILEKASEMVGKYISDGSIVVYESTVYPGATEEVCVPRIESTSGKKAGQDFWVGYSPERVNPGDKKRTIDKITKIVAGQDEASLQVIDGVYGAITTTHKAATIKVAEAAKVIENTQRDINIALMNELSMVFHTLGIDTHDVLAAAGTKWNFLPFEPGLVGGHCIGVDPYYLTYKAQQAGHEAKIILAGRAINDAMHQVIADAIQQYATQKGQTLTTQNVVVWGITFKENVPDVRNSKVASLHASLVEYGATPYVCDPVADPADVAHEYNISLTAQKALPVADVLVVAVKHKAFANLSLEDLFAQVAPGGMIVDVKHIFDRHAIERAGYTYWSL